MFDKVTIFTPVFEENTSTGIRTGNLAYLRSIA